MQDTPTSPEGSSEEQELLAGLRRGDRAVVTDFVQAHIGWMRALALRLVKDEGLAEDCVQEALMKTWLHRITINEALMKLRSRKRLEEDLIDPLLPDFDETGCRIEAPWQRLDSADEILDQERQRNLVRSKIDELPESYRIVLMLRDIEEMTTAEVADFLGITESNVKVRLHRARAALKRLLEPLLRGQAL